MGRSPTPQNSLTDPCFLACRSRFCPPRLSCPSKVSEATRRSCTGHLQHILFITPWDNLSRNHSRPLLQGRKAVPSFFLVTLSAAANAIPNMKNKLQERIRSTQNSHVQFLSNGIPKPWSVLLIAEPHTWWCPGTVAHHSSTKVSFYSGPELPRMLPQQLLSSRQKMEQTCVQP